MFLTFVICLLHRGEFNDNKFQIPSTKYQVLKQLRLVSKLNENLVPFTVQGQPLEKTPLGILGNLPSSD